MQVFLGPRRVIKGDTFEGPDNFPPWFNFSNDQLHFQTFPCHCFLKGFSSGSLTGTWFWYSGKRRLPSFPCVPGIHWFHKTVGQHSLNYPPSILFRYLERLVYLPCKEVLFIYILQITKYSILLTFCCLPFLEFRTLTLLTTWSV